MLKSSGAELYGSVEVALGRLVATVPVQPGGEPALGTRTS